MIDHCCRLNAALSYPDKIVHNAVMTAALLPWHRDCPFKSEVLSADHRQSTDSDALTGVTRRREPWRSPGWPASVRQKQRGLDRAAWGLRASAVRPKRQRVSLVLFIFATKMATESAVGREILWLTSAACTRRDSDTQRRHLGTAPTSCVMNNMTARWHCSITRFDNHLQSHVQDSI